MADNNFDGGFLVPEYLPFPKPGVRAALWRKAGRLFNKLDWYERGLVDKNVIEYLTAKMERLELDRG